LGRKRWQISFWFKAGKRVYDVWGVNEDAEYHEAGGSGIAAALQSERLVPRHVKRVANSH
jgi:hypothetical protein